MMRAAVLVVLALAGGCRCPGGTTSPTSAEVRVEPASLAFGDQYVGTTSTQTLELTNAGRASVTVSASTAPPFSVSPAELVVGGGESVSLTVTFAPTAPGDAASVVALTGVTPASVPLVGRGLAVPGCDAPPACARARFDVLRRACVTEQEPDGAPCENACLRDARCVAGECRGTVASSCDDGDACTVDSCSAAGQCLHEPRECVVRSACTAAFCDPATGCGERPLEDGAPCGDPTCRQSPICLGGQCVLRDNPGAADVCVAVDLAAAYLSTCVLTRAGTVRCWGNGMATAHLPFGQRRLYSRVTTIPRAGRPTSLSMNLRSVSPQVAACTPFVGGGFECFGEVVDAGQVVAVQDSSLGGTCWLDVAGVVTCLPPRCPFVDGGDGPCGPPYSEMPVGPETGITQLSGGIDSFCGVRLDGGLVCWGNVHDLLPPAPDGGTPDGGATDGGPRLRRVEVALSRPARSYRRGYGMSCAMFDDGAECRLNREDSPVMPLPATVADAVPTVFTREGNVFLLLRDGGVEACLLNASDGLDCAPLPDAGLPRVTKVATGFSHACFLTGPGDVACLGDNSSAQLSDLSGAPPLVSRVPGVEAVLLGTPVSGAPIPGLGALQRDGGVVTWGNFFIGQNGPQLPRAMGLGTGDARALVVNHLGGCVVRRDGGVACLDQGVVRDVPLPFPMERFSQCRSTLDSSWLNAFGAGVRCSIPFDGGSSLGVRQPFCDRTETTSEVCVELLGARVTCAVGLDGGVRCRGNNRSGHLGTGSSAPVAIDRPVPGVGPVEKLAMSNAQACALERGGRVQCWGMNVVSGTISAPRPLPAVLPFARDLTCGDNHCCVLIGENGVSCWGANTYNELGRDAPASDLPVAVPLPRRVEQLVAYGSTTCARLRDGEVWCWGDNRMAQHGWAPLLGSSTPVWVTQ